MRAVLQRVSQASVKVGEEIVGSIGPGLLVLLGIHQDDTGKEVSWMADKIATLRIFDDDEGRMNLSLLETGGEMLIVSQFTLYGDCRKGRRPSWSAAAPPNSANDLYLKFIQTVRNAGIRTAVGQFQAMMEVSLINDGPVTLILETPTKETP